MLNSWLRVVLSIMSARIVLNLRTVNRDVEDSPSTIIPLSKAKTKPVTQDLSRFSVVERSEESEDIDRKTPRYFPG
jgi:hypothetical protein